MDVLILKNKYLQSLDKTKPVLVALSTGVDSMVLYHLLITNGFKVIIGHVNHHKREQSNVEEKYVRQLELQYNTKAYVLDYHYDDNSNFQADAHEKRYDFFYEIVKKENCSAIITAHHYEDSLETILINLLKGSNVYGYAGIKECVPYKDTIIIRPLLEATKTEFYQYAFKNDLKFFEDESNQEDDYLRNRIRHSIIPELEKENPNLPSAIKNYSTQLYESFNFIRDNTLRFLDNKLEFNGSKFNTLNIAVKKDVINYLFEEYDILTSKEKIDAIIDAIENSRPNISLDIGKGYSFIKQYDLCKIAKINKTKEIDLYINEGEILKISGVGTFKLAKNVNENEIFLKINKINLPLHFRNRQNGDKIDLSVGHKKLKDFLIDKKVPLEDRDKLLIITDSDNNIVWVFGYYRKPCQNNDDNLYLVYEGEKYE